MSTISLVTRYYTYIDSIDCSDLVENMTELNVCVCGRNRIIGVLISITLSDNVCPPLIAIIKLSSVISIDFLSSPEPAQPCPCLYYKFNSEYWYYWQPRPQLVHSRASLIEISRQFSSLVGKLSAVRVHRWSSIGLLSTTNSSLLSLSSVVRIVYWGKREVFWIGFEENAPSCEDES